MTVGSMCSIVKQSSVHSSFGGSSSWSSGSDSVKSSASKGDAMGDRFISARAGTSEAYSNYDTKSAIFQHEYGTPEKNGCYFEDDNNQENNQGGANGATNQNSHQMQNCDENQRMYATLLQNQVLGI